MFFSVFMSLWAVTFLEHWKRSSAVLAHRWDCSEFEDIEARLRWGSTLGVYVTGGLCDWGSMYPLLPVNVPVLTISRSG